MFTGLVEGLGCVTALHDLDTSVSGGRGTSLTISDCAFMLEDAHLGDSISVNGTCLTITELIGSPPTSFKVGIAPETLRRTNLGSLKNGSSVNLERSVLANTRMGGHFVQGHVDAVAEILEVHDDGNAKSYKLQPRDMRLLKYIVEKGYISLDGASLTVTGVEDGTQGWFSVMLISYTQERIVMGAKGVGDEVNVEVDMVGKYVEKSVQGYFAHKAGEDDGAEVLKNMVHRIVHDHMQDR